MLGRPRSCANLSTRRKCILAGLSALVTLWWWVYPRRNPVNDTSAALNATSFDETRRMAILAEFRQLAQQASSTVEEFGESFLRRQRLTQFHQCTNQNVTKGNRNRFSCTCVETTSRNRVLLILPIRDRWSHVSDLLVKLLPILEMQRLCFLIALVEQTQGKPFNKGLLMNAGVVEAVDSMPFFNCIIFHDVDLLPTSDDIRYDCFPYPRHMSMKVDKFDYKLPYLGLIGGVLSLPVKHFLRVNGFSNLFWGWGAEDDDLFERLAFVGIPVTRLTSASYSMIPHTTSEESDLWRRNFLVSVSRKRYRLDGLNSVRYRLEQKSMIPASRFILHRNATTPTRLGTNVWVLHLLIDPFKPNLNLTL